jgi:hypothetical protein
MRRGHRTEASDQSRLTQSKALMDQVRTGFGKFEAIELQLLSQRQTFLAALGVTS